MGKEKILKYFVISGKSGLHMVTSLAEKDGTQFHTNNVLFKGTKKECKEVSRRWNTSLKNIKS